MAMQTQHELLMISTDNPDFIEKVESKLSQNEPVVILLRGFGA
jgi:hypothetical protein